MMPIEENEKPARPISHVKPNIAVTIDEMTISSTPRLRVHIQNRTGMVDLSQQEFMTLFNWSRMLIHEDWD